MNKCIINTFQGEYSYMSFKFFYNVYTFTDFTTNIIEMIWQDRKQWITYPRYLMLLDCLRYWSANLTGGYKLQLIFWRGWKTKYFSYLDVGLTYLNTASHKWLAVEDGFVETVYPNPYQSQLRKYHPKVIWLRSS